MARFSASAVAQATLKAQLSTPSTGVDEVLEVHAASESLIGLVSRPQLIRPFTAGVGTSSNEAIQPLSNQGVPADVRDALGVVVSPQQPGFANSTWITNFITEPEMPVVLKPSQQAPISMTVCVPPGKGIIVGPGSALVLYATSNQPDHNWWGALVWEER